MFHQTVINITIDTCFVRRSPETNVMMALVFLTSAINNMHIVIDVQTVYFKHHFMPYNLVHCGSRAYAQWRIVDTLTNGNMQIVQWEL